MISWLFEPARIRFCEQTLAGPIAHPADTWTNIGPLLAGLFILLRSRQPLGRLLGIAALCTALASAFFHATDTVLGETLDLRGMFLFIFTIAAFQQRRAVLARRHAPASVSRGNLLQDHLGTNRQIIVLVIALTGILTGLSTRTTLFASPAFGLIVALVAMREVLSGTRISRWGWLLVVTFLIAWAFWWLDYLRIFCFPSNHILTGHGVWHLLNGLVFWFAFLHYNGADS